MKILKNKKILFILVAFLFCLFVFSGSSKANFDFIYNDVNYSLPDLPQEIINNNYNFFIKKNKNSSLTLYIQRNKDDFLFQYATDYSCFGWLIPANCGWSSYDFSSSSNSWIYDGGQDFVDKEKSYLFKFLNTEDLNLSDFIIYSSCDIYDEKGNKLFPVAPQKAEAVEIPTIQEAQQIPEIIAKVVKMIIPVCLTILVTLLLISLIQSVIYRPL